MAKRSQIKKPNSPLSALVQIKADDWLKVSLQSFILLVGVLLGGLPYLLVLLMMVLEILLVSLATIPFYRNRSIFKHLFEMTKLTLFMLALLIFAQWNFAAIAQTESGLASTNPHWQSLPLTVSPKQVSVALGLTMLRLVWAVWEARRAPSPKLAWVEQSIKKTTVNALALVLLCFIGLLAGKALLSALTAQGITISADTVMILVFVWCHFFFSLIATLLTAEDLKDVAENPYAS